MPAKRILSALALAALLAACGNQGTQQGSSTTLDDENTVQIAGVIVDQTVQNLPLDALAVAAAKAQVPHQYKERPPLNLFDFRTNLNPGSNR